MNKKIILGMYFILITTFITFVYAQDENVTNGTDESIEINESINCGNGNCDFNETFSCPEDCNKCTSDLGCDDNNSCTTDTCEGTPKECTNTPITCNDNNQATTDKCVNGECEYTPTTSCKGGDNTCPAGCTLEKDSDCDKCNSASNCDDGNPCTNDLCEGSPTSCNHISKNGCNLGNQCVDYGTREEISSIKQYCSKSNRWENQKIKDILCNENYECLTNTCSQGKCMEPAKEPSFIEKFFNILATLAGAFFGIFK